MPETSFLRRVRGCVRAALAIAGLLFVSAQAPAPENPVVAHFRAYRAALERQDLASAETAADAALQASRARDGDGGRTAILAVNLARVRLARGTPDAAYAPAMQAFTIASANPAAGLDPVLAALVLGRAEMTDAHARDGRARLRTALRTATSRPELHGEAFEAAADLGRWLNAHDESQEAIEAWTLAVTFADAAEGDVKLAQAEARLGEGLSRFMYAAIERDRQRNTPTNTRIFFDSESEIRRADQRLGGAEALVRELAHLQGIDDAITPSQRTYARALAWRDALRAYTSSFEPGLVPEEMGAAVCEPTVLSLDGLNFPRAATSAFSVGAVVIKIETNAQDEVRSMRVAAAVPSRWFQQEVERVLPSWRILRGCPGERVSFTRVRFYFTR